jgi:hypothetical protein
MTAGIREMESTFFKPKNRHVMDLKTLVFIRDRNPVQNLGFQGTGYGTLFTNLGFQRTGSKNPTKYSVL